MNFLYAFGRRWLTNPVASFVLTFVNTLLWWVLFKSIISVETSIGITLFVGFFSIFSSLALACFVSLESLFFFYTMTRDQSLAKKINFLMTKAKWSKIKTNDFSIEARFHFSLNNERISLKLTEKNKETNTTRQIIITEESNHVTVRFSDKEGEVECTEKFLSLSKQCQMVVREMVEKAVLVFHQNVEDEKDKIQTDKKKLEQLAEKTSSEVLVKELNFKKTMKEIMR